MVDFGKFGQLRPPQSPKESIRDMPLAPLSADFAGLIAMRWNHIGYAVLFSREQTKLEIEK
ncbi:hypothetical protein [Sulfitobacter sp. 1A15299]|uniref:hypothetical protein n=1 Tax=Sulfitobacter sp. 1A15299 TaxID=3368598 RepID=UPI003746CB49